MQCNWSSKANCLFRRSLSRQSQSCRTWSGDRLASTLPMNARPICVPSELTSRLIIRPPTSAPLNHLTRQDLRELSFSSETVLQQRTQHVYPLSMKTRLIRSAPEPTSRLTTRAPSRSFLNHPPPWNLQQCSFSSISVVDTPDDSLLDVSPASSMSPSQSSLKKEYVPLNSAQMSRAAAHAVRLSVRNGNVMDAVFILNCLYRSLEDGPAQLASLDDFGPVPEGLKPIVFRREVSPRLSNHCFLHAMIRAGSPGTAARLAESMMVRGTKMRSKTLEAIIQALCADPQSRLQAKTSHIIYIAKQGLQPRMLELAECVHDPHTRAAIRILQFARQYSHRRTEQMYSAIVKACLIQGEIFVGCLLFAVLVKDWQLRQARLPAYEDRDAASEDVSQKEGVRRQWRLKHHDHNELMPKVSSLNAILHVIEEAFEKPPRGSEENTKFQETLQGLALLAMMVDQGYAPFPQLSALIRVLYSCPKVRNRVWIIYRGKPIEVKAHKYYHEILLRIIYSLKYPNSPRLRLPRLDRESYNSLLHYALRHRLAPSLADAILDHMMNVRSKALKPGVVTYNILMRSSTLLQSSEMSLAVIHAFKKDSRNAGIFTEDEPATPSMGEAVPYRMRLIVRTLPDLVEPYDAKERREGYRAIARRLHMLDLKIPVDLQSIVNYILHLTSTGRPHLVADLLFRLIPELHVIDHPSMPKETLKVQQREKREVSLKLLAQFGPHFFAAVLNALVKSGRTGLAERVWLLALHAQRISWSMEDVESWCLTAHAYTSMMQCYANEAQKPIIKPGSDDSPDWTPRTTNKVRGWARLVLMRRGLGEVPRRDAGRQMAHAAFRSLSSGGTFVLQSLKDLHELGSEVGIPSEALPAPDARFFNAALELFGRHPSLRVRRPPSYWKRRVRFSLRCFSKYGTRALLRTPALQEVAEAMIQHGYSIPAAYRHLFVGRVPLHSLGDSDSPVFDLTPFAYLPVSQLPWRSHRIPVVKRRGLPTRRRKQRRTRTSTNVH